MHSTIFAFSLVLMCGCATHQQSSREAFFRGIPQERNNYISVYETSIEALRYHEEDLLRKINKTIEGIREITQDTNSLNEHLDHVSKLATSFYKQKMLLINELEDQFDPKTDAILFYSYHSDIKQEFGWLITCGATVKKKVVLGEGEVITTDSE